MKLLLLAGTAFLGLAASGSAARAVPFDFTYTGSLVTFTVPTTDTYQILAFGAQGGNGTFDPLGFVGVGGRGAEIGGDFSLTAGEILQIAVGGVGSDSGGGGGGGGSFVVGPGNTPLVIAGGGGGGGAFIGFPLPGGGGLTGPDGGVGGVPNGGTGGNGGGDGFNPGGGGGGGGFSAPAAALSPAVAAAHSRISQEARLAAALAVVGVADPALAVAAVTAAAAAAPAAKGVMAPVVVAAPSTWARTRSWSPISRSATARS
jgi:hypothetical protein